MKWSYRHRQWKVLNLDAIKVTYSNKELSKNFILAESILQQGQLEC